MKNPLHFSRTVATPASTLEAVVVSGRISAGSLLVKEVSALLICTTNNAVYFRLTRRAFPLFRPDLAFTRVVLFRFPQPLPPLLFRVFLFPPSFEAIFGVVASHWNWSHIVFHHVLKVDNSWADLCKLWTLVGLGAPTTVGVGLSYWAFAFIWFKCLAASATPDLVCPSVRWVTTCPCGVDICSNK